MLFRLNLIALLLMSSFAYSQDAFNDSLRQVIQSNSHDTLKCAARNSLAWRLKATNPDESIRLAKTNLQEIDRIGYERAKGSAFFSLGYALVNLDSSYAGIPYLDSAANHFLRVDNTNWASMAINVAGLTWLKVGRPTESIKTHLRALKIREESDDKKGIAGSLNNIGNVYQNLKDYDKAREYYERAIVINDEIDNPAWKAFNLGNIGNGYTYQGDYEKAIEYHEKARKIHEVNGDTSGLANAEVNFAINYKELGELDKAIEHYRLAESYSNAVNSNMLIAYVKLGMGSVYLEKNQIYDAIKAYMEGLDISVPRNYLELSEPIYLGLKQCYDSLGIADSAYHYYKNYVTIKDSLFNASNIKNITQADMQFQFEKQLVADSVGRAEAQRIADLEQRNKDLENEQQLEKRNLIIYLAAGLLFILAFVFIYIYRQYKAKKELSERVLAQKKQVEAQREELQFQKELVDEKNQEIIDSIGYAKRLQNAILPSREKLKIVLGDGSILFKPKDIVSGDFYWAENIDGWQYFAVFDCTGHGVPGAMVSMVGKNALDKCLQEHGLRTPSDILDKLTGLVEATFESSDTEIKDGMDAALCRIKGDILEFAGAYNPVWVFRDKNCFEIKGDKQPIGKFSHRKPFQLQSMTVQKGDVVYLFSDGYADQFGGEKGKKMKLKNFKNLILNHLDLSPNDRNAQLEAAFEKWKGSYEQLDDVCVLSVVV